MSLHNWSNPTAAMHQLRRVVRPAGQIWIYDARLALRRGASAARTAFPADAVRQETVHTGRLPINLVGRLLIER